MQPPECQEMWSFSKGGRLPQDINHSENSKQMHAIGAKRGETLVLVSPAIGQENGK